MNMPAHHTSELFKQLGLPNDAWSIAQFVSTHAAMAQGVRLPDAPFWTRSQAAFLRESLSQDSDWSGLVDQLGKALQDAAGTSH
jgi:hypothetical protein